MGSRESQVVGAPSRLPDVAVHQVHELVAHGIGRFVPRTNGGDGTVLEVIAEQFAADGAQGLVHGGDLREDLGAGALLVHHAVQAAYLTLDAAQARKCPRLQLRVGRQAMPGVQGIGRRGGRCVRAQGDLTRFEPAAGAGCC